MKKILNILLGVLMAVTVVIVGYAVLTSTTDGANEAAISLSILWTYVLLMFTLGATVFCVAWGMMQNTSGIKAGLASLVLVVIIIGGAYFVSNGHSIQIIDLQNGGVFDQGLTVITETSILVTYVSLVAAFAVAIGAEVYAAFK